MEIIKRNHEAQKQKLSVNSFSIYRPTERIIHQQGRDAHGNEYGLMQRDSFRRCCVFGDFMALA
jgi:hypothetical protein